MSFADKASFEMAFSGKKKKEQLKAKREKKRDAKENEKNNEVNTECAAENAQKDSHLSNQVHFPGGSTLETHLMDVSQKPCRSNSSSEVNEELYKYGADRRGVRSVFKKETTEELEARRKRNYSPLQGRCEMTTDGIPYEKWLVCPGFPSSVSSVFSSSGKGAGTTTILSPPSLYFSSLPLSVEIPHRGWKLTDIENTRAESRPDAPISEDDSSSLNSSSSSPPDLSAERIQAVEKNNFTAYISKLDALPTPSIAPAPLNIFERNVEVWQQLWRTVEASDVILLVVDVRFPLLHLPISLLRYILVEQQKPCMVVLNKADLVASIVLERWLAFLPLYMKSVGLLQEEEPMENRKEEEIPSLTGSSPSRVSSSLSGSCLTASEMRSVSLPPIRFQPFTLNPEAEFLHSSSNPDNNCATSVSRRRKMVKKRAHLYTVLRKGELLSKSSQEEMESDTVVGMADGEDGEVEEEEEEDTKDNTVFHPSESFKGMKKAVRELHAENTALSQGLHTVSAILTALLRECRSLGQWQQRNMLDSEKNFPSSTNQTKDTVFIGLVGHPNAGKSSLLNCIRGSKVVSVSASAGHTKHLQTIPILEEGVTLVDSPGVVFPVFGIPRPLQAIIGTHQIAQSRDPQSCVGYLAMHLPLEKLFGLRKPEGACEGDEWSAYDLCEAFAKKKGFFVKHGKGNLDVHRASISIVQEAFEGRLSFYFAPPTREFLESKEFRETIKPFLYISVDG